MEDDMQTAAGLGGGGGSRSTRAEMGVVMYAANVLGSRGPRKMQVAIPGELEITEEEAKKQQEESDFWLLCILVCFVVLFWSRYLLFLSSLWTIHIFLIVYYCAVCLSSSFFSIRQQ